MHEAGFEKVEAYVLRRNNALLFGATDFGPLRGDVADSGDVVCDKAVGAEGSGPGGIAGGGGRRIRGWVGGRDRGRSRVSSR